MWVTRAGTQRPRQLAPGVNIATQHLFLVKVESELERTEIAAFSVKFSRNFAGISGNTEIVDNLETVDSHHLLHYFLEKGGKKKVKKEICD